MRGPTWGDFARAVRAKMARDVEQERARSGELLRHVASRVAEAVESARRQGLCREAWLFGSFAWGMPADRSDVDVLVADCPDPDGVAALVARAAEREAHVLERERAQASLVERTLREGKRL